jgi:hypothetical protein
VAPRFLENLWTRGVKYIFECFVQFLFVPINVLERYTRCRGQTRVCVIMPACDCSKISVLIAPRRCDKYFFLSVVKFLHADSPTCRPYNFKLTDQCLQPVVVQWL